MNAGELRRFAKTFGAGPTTPPAPRRYLPVWRCQASHEAVIQHRWQAAIAPPRLAECATCGMRIPRLAPEGRCETCRGVLRGDAARETVLPRLHERARFGSRELAAWCRDAEAIERALAFAENPPDACRALVLTGPTGAGKSSLVSAIVQRLMDTGRCTRLVWTDAKRLAQARMEHALGAGEPPAVQRALAAELLVVDDLGKELVFPAAMSAEVVTLLERRHAGERPRVPAGALDIITTELPIRLPAEEAARLTALHEPVRDLTRLYDLSFVRRIAGALVHGAAARGSAVVIGVRKCQ